MRPYYEADGITIYHGDCREVLTHLGAQINPWGGGECVIADPPWDEPEWWDFITATVSSDYESLLAFTDARRIGDPMRRFGVPDWLFVWDTMNTWSVSPRQPVQQTKHCLWYRGADAEYRRDGVLWGDAPPERNHPSTKQTPLSGRRLTDLYRESSRWLHHPGAGSGSAGTERFAKRQGDPVLSHAKPTRWLACLIGNTSHGPVIDPFMGTGSSMQAARDLGRPAIGIEINELACEVAATRLAQGVLDLGGAA